jgi:NAD(P)-dependent dehydrogenase (short-subunit alcohol dehydrogenase family)
LGDWIGRGEVTPREQLPEVQAFVVHGPQRKVQSVPNGNLFDLTAKTAIVTGGGRGLGKAIALGLAGAGADVVVASRKVENCESAAREIEALGRRALAVACHVGRTDQIDSLVDTAYSTFGQVDIVVNNAAMSPGTQLVHSSPELFHKTYATNTLGPMWLSSRCAERMRDHGGGAIINVITTGAFRPGAGLGLYCSSKAALHALTLVMAKEWASWGVRVNEIAPGPFLTDMMAPGAADPEFTARMYDQMLIKRIADPTEIVGALLYLASAASGFATGTTVTVDGGISA